MARRPLGTAGHPAVAFHGLTINIKSLAIQVKPRLTGVRIVERELRRVSLMNSPHVSSAALLGWVDCGDAAVGTLPLASFVALTERVAHESHDDTRGWTLGMQYDLRRLGAIEGALRSAPTLGAALTLLVDYFSLMQDASELTLAHDEGSLTLTYRILDPEIWPRHQDAIFTLGIVAQLVRLAAGPCWDKAQVGVECDEPDALARLALRSGLHCSGGANSNWLRIPAAFADLPMARIANPSFESLRMLDRLLVQKRRATTVEARVRALIYRQLGDRPISQECIARCLGMSSRTLRRHLAASQTSFQDLVDDCRLRQAAHEFRVRRNVSEHSTFTRAFARWSGMPPQSFIRAHAGA
jgi:AraC-like DNA-binding protein